MAPRGHFGEMEAEMDFLANIWDKLVFCPKNLKPEETS